MVLTNEDSLDSISNEMVNLNLNSEEEDDEQQPEQQVLDSNNLYVKGLWKDCSQIQLDDLFHPYGVICQSRVYGNGIGFVRYETPQQAYAAILALNNTKPHARCPQPLVVQFAHKKFYKPKSVLNVGNEQIEMFVRTNTKNVYIRNLPKNNFTEVDFTLLCQTYGMINCIRLCNGFGFVRYFDEMSAQNCIHALHGKFLPYAKFPLVAKLANSDPFEPRIQFRPHGQTQSPQLQSITGPINMSNTSPPIFPTVAPPTFVSNTLASPYALAATTIGRSVSPMTPMMPQLMNTISNEPFINPTNTNMAVPGYPLLQFDYSFGRLPNILNNTATSTTSLPGLSSDNSAFSLNAESATVSSPSQTQAESYISNQIPGINRVVTTPPISCYQMNNHNNNNCMGMGMGMANIPIPTLQSTFSN